MVARNNPFNIRYNPLNHWKGQVGKTKGFVVFRDLKFGIRAALYLFAVSYPKKGITGIAEAIRRFAPPSENNTDVYVNFVCDKLKMLPFDYPKTKGDYYRLLCYVWHYEQGKHPSAIDILLISETIDDLWKELGRKD